MRILIDVLGAPETSGGMRAYAEELIFAWTEVAPEDQLIVVGDSWILPAFDLKDSVTPIVVPSQSTFSRVASQLIYSAAIFSFWRCDILLSLSPVVTPFAPRRKRFSVVHDWRHLRRPSEFSFAQKCYRSLWKWSATAANKVFVISQKTLGETNEIAPKARAVLAENGRDHSRRWSDPVNVKHVGKRVVVTFGHHSNKRPDLVIAALKLLDPGIQEDLVLVVLGAEGIYREQLKSLASSCGVERLCVFPGFATAQDYQSLMANASVVALVSSDEGFGLPIAEAEYFGVPALVTSDSGVAQLHGSKTIEVEPTPVSVAAGLSSALNDPIYARGEKSSISAVSWSWRDTAQTIRSEISPSI